MSGRAEWARGSRARSGQRASRQIEGRPQESQACSRQVRTVTLGESNRQARWPGEEAGKGAGTKSVCKGKKTGPYSFETTEPEGISDPAQGAAVGKDHWIYSIAILIVCLT